MTVTTEPFGWRDDATELQLYQSRVYNLLTATPWFFSPANAWHLVDTTGREFVLLCFNEDRIPGTILEELVTNYGTP